MNKVSAMGLLVLWMFAAVSCASRRAPESAGGMTVTVVNESGVDLSICLRRDEEVEQPGSDHRFKGVWALVEGPVGSGGMRQKTLAPSALTGNGAFFVDRIHLHDKSAGNSYTVFLNRELIDGDTVVVGNAGLRLVREGETLCSSALFRSLNKEGPFMSPAFVAREMAWMAEAWLRNKAERHYIVFKRKPENLTISAIGHSLVRDRDRFVQGQMIGWMTLNDTIIFTPLPFDSRQAGWSEFFMIKVI